MIMLFNLFTAALISSCAHISKEHQQSDPCERAPSSRGLSCTAFLKNSKLAELDLELESYRADLENAEDDIARYKVSSHYLQKHIDEGNSVYLDKNKEFIFI